MMRTRRLETMRDVQYMFESEYMACARSICRKADSCLVQYILSALGLAS
jgi:hypothetical protein